MICLMGLLLLFTLSSQLGALIPEFLRVELLAENDAQKSAPQNGPLVSIESEQEPEPEFPVFCPPARDGLPGSLLASGDFSRQACTLKHVVYDLIPPPPKG